MLCLCCNEGHCSGSRGLHHLFVFSLGGFPQGTQSPSTFQLQYWPQIANRGTLQYLDSCLSHKWKSILWKTSIIVIAPVCVCVTISSQYIFKWKHPCHKSTNVNRYAGIQLHTWEKRGTVEETSLPITRMRYYPYRVSHSCLITHRKEGYGSYKIAGDGIAEHIG